MSDMVLGKMLLELVKAQAKAFEEQEAVYVSHDRNGNWYEVGDGDDEVPDMMIAVSPDGSIRLIDNSPDCSGLCMYEQVVNK